MRVLLDECLPRRLKAELPDHDVRTVQEEGWAGLKNGALLRVAAGRFDVLLTVDRRIAFQAGEVEIEGLGRPRAHRSGRRRLSETERLP